MSLLRVLQYNEQKSKNRVMVPLLDGPGTPYDVIAVQEPWLNLGVETTYCPQSCPYYLVFPQGGRARTCLYINKRIPLAKWHSYEELDYCRVRIDTQQGPITIHNIYSEIPESTRTIAWNTPINSMLEAVQAPGQHLVVGDFNLHHPLWGGPNVTQIHAAADILITGMLERRLQLLLRPGTTTQEKNNERSTLDLALATEGLASIASCQVTNAFAGSDHLPIETTIQLDAAIRASPAARRCFKKANLEMVQARAQQLQCLDSSGPTDLQDPQEIDSYVSYLVHFIQELISQTVPLARPSQQAQP
jgi:hypothetical protein